MHATETAELLKEIVNGRLVILVAYRRVTALENDGRYVVAGRDLKHHARLIVATVDTHDGTYEDERGDVGDWTPEAVDAALAERVAAIRAADAAHIAVIDALSIRELRELVDQADEHRGEAFAEAGSGAMSLGYGQDGAYAAGAHALAELAPNAAERHARKRIADYEEGRRRLGVTDHHPGFRGTDGRMYGASGVYAGVRSSDPLPF